MGNNYIIYNITLVVEFRSTALLSAATAAAIAGLTGRAAAGRAAAGGLNPPALREGANDLRIDF